MKALKNGVKLEQQKKRMGTGDRRIPQSLLSGSVIYV